MDIRRQPHRLQRSPEDLEAEARLIAWGVPDRKITRQSIDEVRTLIEDARELKRVLPGKTKGTP